MPISVTPFMFLLNAGAGICFCGLFVVNEVHQRIDLGERKRVKIIDTINVSLSVVLISLFLLWSTGVLLSAYFGDYAIFQEDMPRILGHLLKLEILADITQKILGFTLLGTAAFQASSIGKIHTLVPWGKVCISLGVLQGMLYLLALVVFKGAMGWILLYITSGMISMALTLFSILTLFILKGQLSQKGISSYLPNKLINWNIRSCLQLLLSAVLDVIVKMSFVSLELHNAQNMQLVFDILSLLRTVATFLIVNAVFTLRIPSRKAYLLE
ncbi:hypothetical protein NEOKW01_0447 [Nematocida sp. AWRm80]|nr:hypothetical protein NEOKW01_0447 [Nematocida sp. AWRm80]